MTVAAFHKSFACRSEGHCTACRGDADWRARIGPKYGIPTSETPWRCRKDPIAVPSSGTMYQSPMRGAGDLVAKITKAVGIAPCKGCAKRQEWLNHLIPFKEKYKDAVIKHRGCAATPTMQPAMPATLEMVSYTDLTAAMKAPGNAIIWGGNWHRKTYKSVVASTLFVENGLIDQKAGFYLDGSGFFSESSIAKQRLWDAPVTDADRAGVTAAVAKGFSWEWGQSTDPNGPIVVALQRRLDTGCYRFFPKNTVKGDPIDSLLEYCAKYLPKNRKVLIRPHPRYKPEWENKRKEYVAKHFQPNWEVNLDGGIYPMLLQASALVTVNSTVASEAMALNIPIATLGEGAWTGSDATLECAQDPAKLAGILDAKPDMERRMAVQSAILRRQVRYGDTAAFAKHPAYLDWLNRLQ